MTAAIWEPLYLRHFGRNVHNGKHAALHAGMTWRRCFRLECAASVRRKLRRVEEKVETWRTHVQELSDFICAEKLRLVRLQKTTGSARRKSEQDVRAAEEGEAKARSKLEKLAAGSQALRKRLEVLACRVAPGGEGARGEGGERGGRQGGRDCLPGALPPSPYMLPHASQRDRERRRRVVEILGRYSHGGRLNQISDFLEL
jgi:hypothetical protein